MQAQKVRLAFRRRGEKVEKILLSLCDFSDFCLLSSSTSAGARRTMFSDGPPQRRPIVHSGPIWQHGPGLITQINCPGP